MSLVGPRPHAVQHDLEYAQQIAHYFARHKIKPGITGLAQVRGYRGETRDLGMMMLRVESDIEYINNWSLWSDIAILVRTTAPCRGRTHTDSRGLTGRDSTIGPLLPSETGLSLAAIHKSLGSRKK
jgi:lipopolysaccharide/colanic/teichoic acid biosynthesis glycosyltransferase